MRRLVLGGARSGKSTFAEGLVASAPAVDYVATSERRPDDPEWQQRIAAHVARRPASWRTVETLDLPAVLDAPGDAGVLIDCLTVWLTRMMDRHGCWPEWPDAAASARVANEADVDVADPLHSLRAEVDGLVQAVRRTPRDVVLVSNEVGQGVVPATASGRLFRDQMGVANMAVASVCDEVWFVTAGIPQRIRG